MKHILITGCSSGIGRETALRLDQMGWQVWAGVRRPEDGLALQQASTGRLKIVLCDVTNPSHIEAVVQQISQEVGQLDALVNNAGYGLTLPLEMTSAATLRALLEVHVVGVLALTNACLPLLRPVQGRVINLSSGSGLVVTPLHGAYSAAKFALEALSDAWAYELKAQGITVIVIEPGSIATPIWEKNAQQQAQLWAEQSPHLQQLYTPLKNWMAKTISQLYLAPPGRVTETIVKALTAARPAPRYVVGFDGWLAWLTSCLPGRVRRWLVGQAVYWGS